MDKSFLLLFFKKEVLSLPFCPSPYTGPHRSKRYLHGSRRIIRTNVRISARFLLAFRRRPRCTAACRRRRLIFQP
jgi:hypothetical protein